MSERLRRVLGSRTDDFEIRQCLHDVPPHVVHEVTYEGRRAICKLSNGPRGMAGVEGRVLRYVDQETSIPVPSVLAVGPDYFIAEYRDDAPEDLDDEKHVDEAWLRAAGRGLGQLHRQTTFDRSGLLTVDGAPSDAHAGLRVDAAPGTTWSTALDELFGVYQDNLSGTQYGTVIEDARDFLRTHADRFDTGDGRNPVLLHGWFSPDHVTTVDKDVTCVIDFEHALVGSEEWDYWRAMVPLHSGPWEKPAQTQKLFRAGYESMRPLPDGFDTRGRAYQAFVSVSYLDSLQTQQGIDDETRSTAEFLQHHVSETLAELRDDWVK